jgi:hypothetical protein
MLSKIGIRNLDDGSELPLSTAERFLPKGTNPIELHSIEEILATCMIKDLDSGKEATLDDMDKVGDRVSVRIHWCTSLLHARARATQFSPPGSVLSKIVRTLLDA